MNLLASMRYLSALHTHRHFGRAAQACHITQPALSNALRALEDEFGVVIVQRARTYVGLTHEGEAVLATAQRMLRDNEVLRQELRSTEAEPQGRLRMASTPTAVPILGLVENMAVHVCSNCGHHEHIFGADGGKKMAAEYGFDFLGALPLNLGIREQADSGRASVVAEPEGEIAGLYKAMARRIAVKIALRAKDFSSKFPTITISKNT